MCTRSDQTEQGKGEGGEGKDGERTGQSDQQAYGGRGQCDEKRRLRRAGGRLGQKKRQAGFGFPPLVFRRRQRAR